MALCTGILVSLCVLLSDAELAAVRCRARLFARCFPQFVKLQEERFKFREYLFSERAECDDDEACGNDDLGYLRPSPGTKNVPWRPKVDQAAKEQAALLTTCCAGHLGFHTLRHPAPIAL